MISQSAKATLALQRRSPWNGSGLPDPEHSRKARRLLNCAVELPPANGRRHLAFAAKAMIFDEVDEARFVYLIAEGSILISKEFADGRRQIVEMLGSGSVFGLTDTSGYACRAEALQHSRVIAYDRIALENSSKLQAIFYRQLTAQICALHNHVAALGVKSTLERVASFLIRLANQRPGSEECTKSHAVHVQVVMTRQEIADYLGLSLESVCRTFTKLRRDGIIKYCRYDDELVIVLMPKLRQLAGLPRRNSDQARSWY